MPEPAAYEQYPIRIVIASNLLSLSIYLIGALLVYPFGLPWAVLYLLFVLALEFRVVSRHCVDCYYYGKTCAFGKGRLSCRIFPRGEPERFTRNTLTWKDMIPDFLVLLIPLLAGIIQLIVEFRWTILLLLVILVILGFPGTAFVRQQLACRYCKQREIGCPAAQLFGKKNP
jgi:hypothetical protein